MAKKLDRAVADEILGYIAQEMISPLCFKEGTMKDAYHELSSTSFNNLCCFIAKLTEEDKEVSTLNK